MIAPGITADSIDVDPHNVVLSDQSLDLIAALLITDVLEQDTKPENIN